jgi:hypothetical protein
MSVLRHVSLRTAHPRLSSGARDCRKKFLRFFPKGFKDPKYEAWERGYKSRAHEQWAVDLGKNDFRDLLRQKQFQEIAARAVRIESRTNLLFSFEKMALRDALKSGKGAKQFSEGLFRFLYEREPFGKRFEQWRDVVAGLPRKQTRVLTWPVLTVFGFIAEPKTHIFLKPNVTRIAAENYGFDFAYRSQPNFETYSNLLEFARVLGEDLRDLEPRDMIDIQSFIWIQGSEEYA